MSKDQDNAPQEIAEGKTQEEIERKRRVEEFIVRVEARIERKRKEILAAPLASERVQ
jgi:hypothetical protein